MADGNKLLGKAYSIRGADMGRRTIVDNDAAKVQLFQVRLDSGGYDHGGAYWGFGTNPLYGAIGDDFQTFIRAANRDDAKRQLKEKYPKLRFYR